MKITGKIIFGLLIVVIIIYLVYINVNKRKEGFVINDIKTLDTTIQNLSAFASGFSSIDPKSMTPQQIQDLQSNLVNEIKNLSSSLNLLNDQMKVQNNNTVLKANITPSEQSTDIKNIQLMQDKEISQLTERLNTLKNTYNNYLQEKSIDEHPKIPIYSSCIMSEASGGYSLDKINKQVNIDPNTPIEKPIVNSNQSVVPGVSSYNYTKNINMPNDSFTLDDIMDQLSQSAINVNFNV